MTTNKDNIMVKDNASEWKNSGARNHLCNLPLKNQIPADMKPKQVHAQFCKDDETFHLFAHGNFASRLRHPRSNVCDRNDKAARDAAAFTADCLICPRPCSDGFGLPLWATAEAKKLLCDDIDNGRHKSTTREELRTSREE